MMNPKKASTCLRTAYDLLNMMQRLKLQPTDEVRSSRLFLLFMVGSLKDFVLSVFYFCLLGLLPCDDAAVWCIQHPCFGS